MQPQLKTILAFGAGAIISAVGVTQAPEILGGEKIDSAKVQEIVREVIKNEPQIIVDSVQNMQKNAQQQKVAKASEALKDSALRAAIFENKNSPFVGDANSKSHVVEFFDYNCPACKMQFKALSELAAKDKGVKIIFKEFPIFGEQSDKNSKIALAVHRLAPGKYFAFHEKMMNHQGRADEKTALGFAKALGLDEAKVSAEAAKPEVAQILADNRKLGDSLMVQGTPTVIVGEEVIPHAISFQEIEQKLGRKAN